jgi:SAM-dependent methyltransferase
MDVAILAMSMTVSTVRWHDIECGGYSADLPLWRELADDAGGEVLDIGCGSGRVTLDLLAHGHAVTGLDRDPDLLAALRERATDRSVTTVEADARDFALDRRFALAIVPMQTVQLLGGAAGRARFLTCARAHLDDGALLAAAVADALEGFDETMPDALPLPDMGEHDGWLFSSQPVAVRDHGDRVAIERIRQTVAPDGTLNASGDVIELDRVDAEQLAAEGRAAGFAAEPIRRIDATSEHVGSRVVMLRAR